MDIELNKGFMIGVLFMVLVAGVMISSAVLGNKIGTHMGQQEKFCQAQGYTDYDYVITGYNCVNTSTYETNKYIYEIEDRMIVRGK